MKTAKSSTRAKTQSSGTKAAKIRFNRSAVLGLLGIPLSAKVEFGGKEWRQEFDEYSVLEVSLP